MKRMSGCEKVVLPRSRWRPYVDEDWVRGMCGAPSHCSIKGRGAAIENLRRKAHLPEA